MKDDSFFNDFKASKKIVTTQQKLEQDLNYKRKRSLQEFVKVCQPKSQNFKQEFFDEADNQLVDDLKRTLTLFRSRDITLLQKESVKLLVFKVIEHVIY
jgi:translation initiation factor 2 alpha subunit (eIF-2alpha)